MGNCSPIVRRAAQLEVAEEPTQLEVAEEPVQLEVAEEPAQLAEASALDASAPADGALPVHEETFRLLEEARHMQNTEFNGRSRFIPAYIKEVHDGDTIHALVRREDFIRNEFVTIKLRLDGIDTPELKSKIEGEKEAAVLAADAVKELVEHKKVYVRLVKHDKYGGRFDAKLRYTQGGIDLNSVMITAGHAYAYHGAKKKKFNAWYDPEKVIDIHEAYVTCVKRP